MIMGQQAIEVGMADRLATLEEVINQLNDKNKTGESFIMSQSNQNESPSSVKTSDITHEYLKAQHSDLVADIKREGQATGFEEGKKAEQTRIAGILDNKEVKGREALAKHLAFNTQTTVDDAIAMLKAAPCTSATIENVSPLTPLQGAMAGIEQPNINPLQDDIDAEQAEEQTLVNAMATGMKA